MDLRNRAPPFWYRHTSICIEITVRGHRCTLPFILEDVKTFMAVFIPNYKFLVNLFYYTEGVPCTGNCFQHSKRLYPITCYVH